MWLMANAVDSPALDTLRSDFFWLVEKGPCERQSGVKWGPGAGKAAGSHRQQLGAQFKCPVPSDKCTCEWKRHYTLQF